MALFRCGGGRFIDNVYTIRILQYYKPIGRTPNHTFDGTVDAGSLTDTYDGVSFAKSSGIVTLNFTEPMIVAQAGVLYKVTDSIKLSYSMSRANSGILFLRYTSDYDELGLTEINSLNFTS